MQPPKIDRQEDITCSDEVQECWTNQTLDTLPEIQVASIEQHAVSENKYK